MISFFCSFNVIFIFYVCIWKRTAA
jgi:hypothetical protein